MDYERAMFGMKISDAQYLARNIRVSQTLVSLSLPCNMIDDELIKVLMGGLSYGHMLTYLDLSHNKIGDRGARRLASLLDPDYCIQSMDLSDNQIHANGCMHLGAHLAKNTTCEVLNLRLNRCEDNGVSHLFQDMCVNTHLKKLNIACNDLTLRCLPYMNSMITENSTLVELDLSANPLYQAEDGELSSHPGGNDLATLATNQAALTDLGNTFGRGDNLDLTQQKDQPEDPLAGLNLAGQFGVFARCLVRSTTLLRLDLRQCGLPPDVQDCLTTVVKHRELRSKGIPVDAYEKSKLAQQQAAEEKIEGEQEGDAAEAEQAEGDAQAEGGDGDAAEEEEKKDEEEEA